MVAGRDKNLRGREKRLSRINRKLFSAITRKNFRKNKDFGKEVAFPDHSWGIQRSLQKEKVFKGRFQEGSFLKRKHQSAHGWGWKDFP